MKKILLSLSMIAVVGVAVVGATGAFFSDTAISSGNTFSSGTMNLKLTDSDETALDSVTASFGGSDLVPGSAISTQTLKVKNDGSVSGHHLNLTVTLPTGLGSDLAKNIILKTDDVDNGLRFGFTSAASDSDNMVKALLALSATFLDYTFTTPGGATFAGVDGNDLSTPDGKLSLNELATAGTIRITPTSPGGNTEGVAAGTEATLYFTADVDTDLVTQGETVVATFTWELQQDASQI